MKQKRVWIAVLVAVVAGAVMVVGTGKAKATDQSSSGSAEVKIDNFSFGPSSLTVAVGTEVTWINRDDIPHTIVSTDGVFKSKVRDTDEKFSYKFTKAGTYSYYCSIHPKMTGKIVVQ